MDFFVSTSCWKGTKTKFEPDIFRVLKAFAKLGIINIELGSAHAFSKDLSQIVKMKASCNFTIHNVFPPIKKEFMMNPASPGKTRRVTIETAKRCIEFARKIDAKLYSLHTGWRQDVDLNGTPIEAKIISRERAIENIVDSISQITDFARLYNLKVAIEGTAVDGPHGLILSAEEYGSLLHAIKSKNLGLLVDLAHLKILRLNHNLDVKHYLDTLGDNIFEFHVSQATSTKDNLPLTGSSVLRESFMTKELAQRKIFTLESTGLDSKSLQKNMSLLDTAIRLL